MITLADIQQAQSRIADVAYRTPLIPVFTSLIHTEHVWIKPESLQPIGSFKIRGAYNRIAALSPEQRAAGVIAYSSGNHAQGVAYAAKRLGVKATIVMPNNAPAIKIEATRGYGADVVLYDPVTEKREEIARQLMAGQQWTLVPPFDDPFVAAGQGTIGLEIYEALPEVDLVVTPIGGGGLISGTATALKSLKPSIKVVGVEPELAADAQESFRCGKIVAWDSVRTNRTIADGTRTTSLSQLTFDHIRQYVDDVITVSEEEIRSAIRHLLLDCKLTIEPSGAMPYAAYLHRRAELPAAQRTVLVLSGGNIDPALLASVINS